ncbi:hypothetical protein AB4Z22_37755, partial [Paenibacillus sp. TAF58]
MTNSVYLPVPGAATFISTETITGKVGGTLSWKAALDQSQLTGYKVYFLDVNNNKVGNLAFVKKSTGSSYRITLPNGTVLPSGAVKIAIAAVNTLGESTNLSILESIENTGTPDQGTDPVQVPSPSPSPSPSPDTNPSPNPGSGSAPASDSTSPKVEISTNDKGQIVVKLTFTNEQLTALIAKQLLSQVDS